MDVVRGTAMTPVLVQRQPWQTVTSPFELWSIQPGPRWRARKFRLPPIRAPERRVERRHGRITSLTSTRNVLRRRPGQGTAKNPDREGCR